MFKELKGLGFYFGSFACGQLPFWPVTVNMLNTFTGQPCKVKENVDAVNMFSETPIELLPLERGVLLLASFPGYKKSLTVAKSI